MSDELLSTSEEFDVSDAGVPTLKGVEVRIADFEVQEKQNGVQHTLTFEVEGLSFPIVKGYWFSHTNPKAANAGRGQLKRIALAAIGSAAYNSTNLIDTRVVADVGENADGFAEISKFRKVEQV